MTTPENPYERFRDEELILRDELAVDRTILANERTLLAYLRTALTFLTVGLSFLNQMVSRRAFVIPFGNLCPVCSQKVSLPSRRHRCLQDRPYPSRELEDRTASSRSRKVRAEVWTRASSLAGSGLPYMAGYGSPPGPRGSGVQ